MDKKTNNQDYLDVLKQHGITRLYHYPDRDNLQSIVDNGGLLSWADCEAKGIQIPKPAVTPCRATWTAAATIRTKCVPRSH